MKQGDLVKLNRVFYGPPVLPDGDMYDIELFREDGNSPLGLVRIHEEETGLILQIGIKGDTDLVQILLHGQIGWTDSHFWRGA